MNSHEERPEIEERLGRLPDRASAGIGPLPDGPRALGRNMLYAVGGMGFYSASQLGVTILLAKFTSSEVLGNYFYALALSTPIVLLFGLELRAVFVADTRNEFSFGVYRAARFHLLAIAALILALVLLVSVLRQGPSATLALLAFVFLGKLQWAFSELSWGVFNRRERLDHLAGATFLRGISMLACYALILPLSRRSGGGPDQGAWAAAAAAGLNTLAWAAVDRFFDARRLQERNDLDLRWTWPALLQLAKRALPMGLVAMTVNLNDSVPRIVLKYAGSPAALGYFGALFAITLVGQLVVVQTTNAAANRIALAFRNDRAVFWRLFRRLLGIAAAVGALLFVVMFTAGGPLLRILYRPEYATYEFELRIVVAAQLLALLTSVLGLTCTQMGVFWAQVPAQAATLGATTIAALLLIPVDPVRGAAWTAMVRAIVQLGAYATCMIWGMRRSAKFEERRTK